VTNNQTGIIAAVGGGTLDHVVANQNTQEGVRVGDRIGVTAVDTIADDNGTGFAILSFRSSLSLAHSTATGNGTGVNVIAGSAISFGDNHIHGNGTDVKGTLTKVGTQ
jgi:hypothetical protein